MMVASFGTVGTDLIGEGAPLGLRAAAGSLLCKSGGDEGRDNTVLPLLPA